MRTSVFLRKMFFVLSRAWDKEKILSPHEESNLRPLDLHSDALPLSHRDFTVSKVYYEESLWLSGRASECKSKGLRFNSSWGLIIFSLSHACDIR